MKKQRKCLKLKLPKFEDLEDCYDSVVEIDGSSLDSSDSDQEVFDVPDEKTTAREPKKSSSGVAEGMKETPKEPEKNGENGNAETSMEVIEKYKIPIFRVGSAGHPTNIPMEEMILSKDESLMMGCLTNQIDENGEEKYKLHLQTLFPFFPKPPAFLSITKFDG